MKKKQIDFPEGFETTYSTNVKQLLNEMAAEYTAVEISKNLKEQINNIWKQYKASRGSSHLSKKQIRMIVLKKLEYKYKIEKETFKYFEIAKKDIGLTEFVKKNVEVETQIAKKDVEEFVLYESEYMKKVMIDKVEQLTKKEKVINDEVLKKIQKEAREKTLRQAELSARNKAGDLYVDSLRELTSQIDCKLKWVTVGDDRVRPEHEERDGVVYNIDELDLWPGEDFGCRCQGEIIQTKGEE